MERKKPAKSETLTIRLDPKMRFALEFVAKIRGQSITTVVERAIKRAADEATIGGNQQDSANWLDFWDVSDGIRSIKLAQDHDTFPGFEEEERLDFVRTHWPFFSERPNLEYLRRDLIDILWPHIESLIVHWRDYKSVDRWATGKLMQQYLREAKAEKIPAWPQPQPKAPKIATPDDIPF